MTAPLSTPLIVRSDFTNEIAGSPNTAVDSAILDKIIEESDRLQAWCKRRFDERIETRSHTALPEDCGGHLANSYELVLSDDLRALTTLKYLVDPYTPGSGTTISSGYLLLPSSTANGVTAYSRLRLNPYGSVLFYSTTDPVNSISVTGTWGYGGQWRDTRATVASGLASDAAATSFVASGVLEVGLMLKIDSEYLYVRSVPGTTLYVERGVNGSTATTHTNATTIYRWEADPVVRRHLKRLVLISIAQDKSPLLNSLIVGDVQAVVASDGNPKDVLYDVERAGLRRVSQRWGAV